MNVFFRSFIQREIQLQPGGDAVQNAIGGESDRSLHALVHLGRTCASLSSGSSRLSRVSAGSLAVKLPPSVLCKVNVCSYLRLVALAEGVRLESDDAHGLVGLFGVDVRRCLLQLQLWVLGGGASPEEPSCVRRELL